MADACTTFAQGLGFPIMVIGVAFAIAAARAARWKWGPRRFENDDPETLLPNQYEGKK